MSSHILSKFKILVVEDFIDPELCAVLRADARAGVNKEANVINRGSVRVDKSVRSTRVATLDTPAAAAFKARVRELKPRLEGHFNLTLAGYQDPHFLTYGPDDFFQPHRDNNYDPLDTETIRARRVSVVVFLNGASEEPAPETFGGGSLVFYGLLPDARCATIGFPLAGKPGLMVAFPVDMMHEVAPITRGERYTAVTWFY